MTAAKGMSLHKEQEWVKAHRLQTGGIEEGQIQAGALLLFQYRVGQPHPLSHYLIGSRRAVVDDLQLLQCPVDGRHL